MPKLSFVCPTKNRIAWLHECIDSLRKQTEQDIEIIIVDDGSTDYTPILIDWLCKQDNRIKSVRNEVSQGAGYARNMGNQIATADIICCVDDDDFYTPDRAEITLKYFADNPSIDAVCTSCARVDYHGKVAKNQYGENVIYKSQSLDVPALLEKGVINYWNNPSAAYRRKDILELPYRKDISGDKSVEMTDDRMMIEDWARAGKKFGSIESVTCSHRVLPGSVMTNIRNGDLT